MGIPNRIGDQDVERLFSRPGASAETSDEMRELASFVSELRASVPAVPSPDVSARLVPRLATVARAANDRAATDSTAVLTPVRGAGRGAEWRRRLALFARVAVAVALVPALLAGLAFAGLTLPEPAQEAFERLGIELPNQSPVDDGQAGDGETRGSDRATAAKDKTADEDADAAAAGPQHGANHPKGAPGKAKAKGHHKGHGKPDDTGPSGGISPGQGAEPPGQGGVPPGNGGVPPGTPATPPSAGSGAPSTPPGQGGVPPGQAED
jgi:hypothetical protein